MHGVKQKWTRHCVHLSVDPLDHLAESTKEDIMTFLEWMLDSHRRIRKRSTVHAYKRIFFQVYRKSVGADFSKQANEEINDYINGYLTIRYKLDTSVNEKPVMGVDDVYLVQHHHWVHDTSVFPDERQRIQLAFLVLLQAYTATRPRVLAYKRLDKNAVNDHYFGCEDEATQVDCADEFDPKDDDFKTICYRDVQLLLLKNPEGGRDLPAMEVTLRYTKGWERRENPKTFIFYEVDDLLFDAVLHLLALALLDQAFEANIQKVDDFYRIRILNPYCIRRGSGEAVESTATQAQLQQVMCHINAATYQAYINQRVQCDTVAAFLGRPSNKALLKAAGHMSRHADPRAPTDASAIELRKIKTNPTLVSLIGLRDSLTWKKEDF
ncbi:FluG domain-containing protein [Hirsutella rhossiliensis]